MAKPSPLLRMISDNDQQKANVYEQLLPVYQGTADPEDIRRTQCMIFLLNSHDKEYQQEMLCKNPGIAWDVCVLADIAMHDIMVQIFQDHPDVYERIREFNEPSSGD